VLVVRAVAGRILSRGRLLKERVLFIKERLQLMMLNFSDTLKIRAVKAGMPSAAVERLICFACVLLSVLEKILNQNKMNTLMILCLRLLV
jgi:hypothetical protein